MKKTLLILADFMVLLSLYASALTLKNLQHRLHSCCTQTQICVDWSLPLGFTVIQFSHDPVCTIQFTVRHDILPGTRPASQSTKLDETNFMFQQVDDIFNCTFVDKTQTRLDIMIRDISATLPF